MSLWVGEEPLSASALGACYPQLQKGQGEEMDTVPLSSQWDQELPQQYAAWKGLTPRQWARWRMGEGSPEDGSTKGNKGEKRMFLHSFKIGNGELCRSQTQEVNYRRLGCEKVTFRNQICIHKTTGMMGSLLLLESCPWAAESQAEYPKPPDSSCDCMWKTTKQTLKRRKACPVQKVWTNKFVVDGPRKPASLGLLPTLAQSRVQSCCSRWHRGPSWVVRWHSPSHLSYFLWLCVVDTVLPKHTHVICLFP